MRARFERVSREVMELVRFFVREGPARLALSGPAINLEDNEPL